MVAVLSDVILPNSVVAAAGVRGKNKRVNDRVSNQAGFMTVTSVSLTTLREYEIGFIPSLPNIFQAINGIFEVTDGGASGFLMEDPSDNTTTNGLLQPLQGGVAVGAIGAGYGVPTYQLLSRYTSVGSTRTRDRTIKRPKSSAVLLRAGIAVTIGAGAGNAALDVTTGLVTFVADASQNVSAITVGSTTQVTLAAALPGLVVGGQLWLQGLTGADAALVNNISHTITGIAGAVYTLSTNTAGKTITAAGQGVKYPQPADTLTWTGGFYVPVQFMTDELDWELLVSGPYAGRYVAGASTQLIEVRE